MEVHVSFRGRKPVPQHVDIGMERENKVTVLCFEGLPEMEGSTAYLHIDLGDNGDAIEIIDGKADVTRTITQFTGSVEAFVEMLGANDRVWHSQIMELFVGRLPILGEKIEQAYPTAFEQALAQTAADKAAAAKSAADAAATAAGIVAEEAARKEAESKRVIAEKGRVKAEAQREKAMAQHAEKIAELESEVAKKAEIDDTTVSGAEAWSSQHIVDMLCPPLEESGNPVMCYPVAGSKLGVTASWEPTQEGTGTPSPDNVRPIHGKNNVSITRQEDELSTTLTLPSTIYGGEVDAVTCAGRETWTLLTLTGGSTEKWERAATINAEKYGFYVNVPEIATPTSPGIKGDIACNQYPAKTANETYKCQNGVSVESGNNHYFRIYDNAYAGGTIDEWKSYLAAQYAAGKPVQVAYKLATPTPFTATGGGDIKALSGTNTILTDADALTVKGRADPIHIIQQLQAASASATQALADVERAVTDI